MALTVTFLPLSAISLSQWQQELGRLHVVIVHLPIALLLVAGLVELVAVVRRKDKPTPTALTCLWLGAASAVAASVFGWMHYRYGDFPDSRTLDVHEWLGFITAGVAVLATAFAVGALRVRRLLAPFRVATIAGALLVSVVGHFGGALTHGDGYLTELLFPDTPAAPTATANATTEPAADAVEGSAATAPGAKAVISDLKSQVSSSPSARSAALPEDAAHASVAEYDSAVKPILAKNCFECHGPAKHSGSLRLDSVAEVYKGGKSGAVIVAGHSADSLLIKRVLGEGGKKRMPPDRSPLTSQEVAALRAWIDRDTVAPKNIVHKWSPTIEPVRPKIGTAIDLVLASYYASHNVAPASLVDDRTYARRVYLDTVGMLPTPEELARFLSDTHADKRPRLVKALLADDRRYAENWMSFWNDALRNDYRGTGYIDGGRKQITSWLYHALESNMPYDEFVRQLIDPTPESEGFVKGIVWRGTVSQSQRPELQAAQNISQVFLGINMKCASCHDSFINDWKLADAYGLAAVYADKPLDIYRCEKANGQKTGAKFIYPQVGTIDANAPKAQRMKQLASLMTSPDNGRLARTIVNRLWDRFLGRGLVEPLDEMDNEPWDPDLLDFLAVDLMDNGYDLKRTIYLILTSNAYQLPAQPMADPSESSFTFKGPVVRRLSAEQFCDAVSQVTGDWHQTSAAKVDEIAGGFPGKFIWSTANAVKSAAAGTVHFRKTFDLPTAPTEAVVSAMADNRVTVYLNGHEVGASDDWGKPVVTENVAQYLVPGTNTLVATATNDAVRPDGASKNPAAFWALLSVRVPDGSSADGKVIEIASDTTWEVNTPAVPATPAAAAPTTAPAAASVPDAAAVAAAFPPPAAGAQWGPARLAGNTKAYGLQPNLDKTGRPYMLRRYRAVWANNDPLMTALGRPNREQVVTYRPTAATTLQALELTNGSTLATILNTGGQAWAKRPFDSTRARVTALYQTTLCRPPTETELAAATQLLGPTATPAAAEDLIWSLLMLPEFQLIY